MNPTLSLIDQISDTLSIPSAKLLPKPSYTPSELVVIKHPFSKYVISHLTNQFLS